MEELDLLGESLLKQHLPDRSHSNQIKNEKIPLNVLQQKKKEQDLGVSPLPITGSATQTPDQTKHQKKEGHDMGVGPLPLSGLATQTPDQTKQTAGSVQVVGSTLSASSSLKPGPPSVPATSELNAKDSALG